MANLISAELKSQAAEAMLSIFDSFSRSDAMIFYKISSEVIAVYDPNYNADFMEKSLLSTVTHTTQNQSFTCRINYLDRQDYSSFVEGGDDPGIKGKFYYNRIKLQCKSDAFDYLKEAERFEILGEKYQIEEAWRRIGILDTFQFYQIILRRVN